MSEGLVVLLVLLWAMVLLPGALRSRRANAHATVGGFERAMEVLRTRPPGREILVPHDAGRLHRGDVPTGAQPGADWQTSGWEPRSVPTGAEVDAAQARASDARARRLDPVLARRRTVFARLGAVTGVTLPLALLVGGSLLWTATLVSVALTVGYAAVLRRWKLQRDEARAVVHTLHATARRDAADTAPREPLAAPRAVGDEWGDVAVAHRPDEPWRPSAGVRIRRWED